MPGWIQTLAGWTLAGKTYLAGLMSHLVKPTSGLGKLLSHLVTDSAVGLLYFVMFFLLVFASFVLGPNANSLHRLYRDRLSNAFLFRRKLSKDGGPDPVAAISYLHLSRLSHRFSPYHLINSALKIGRAHV